MPHVVRSLMSSSFVAVATLSWLAIGAGLPVQAGISSALTRTLKYEYPEAVVQVYVDACGSEGIDPIPQPVMYEICVCTIEEFQAKFSLEAFRKIGATLRADRDVPPAMHQIMQDCLYQVMLPADV